MTESKETTKVVEQQPIQMFVVPPALMKQTLDLLQNELAMSKCRDVVLKLEQCRIASINPQQKNSESEDV